VDNWDENREDIIDYYISIHVRCSHFTLIFDIGCMRRHGSCDIMRYTCCPKASNY
jgi:hypothetical protein